MHKPAMQASSLSAEGCLGQPARRLLHAFLDISVFNSCICDVNGDFEHGLAYRHKNFTGKLVLIYNGFYHELMTQRLTPILNIWTAYIKTSFPVKFLCL